MLRTNECLDFANKIIINKTIKPIETKKELMNKAKGDKKLSKSDAKLLKQVNLALTLKNIKESKKVIRLTEQDLYRLVKRVMNEQLAK